jgi:CHAT domain-containing protein/tetratricopeptide (TPR) repeat protein
MIYSEHLFRHAGLRLGAACVCWLLLTAAAARGDQQAAVQQPAPAKTLDRLSPVVATLSGGQIHSYVLVLDVRQFVDLVVDQRGIDVVVVLFDPAGTQLLEVDSPNGASGPEPVQVVTVLAGNYRLEVRALDPAAAKGEYEARIVELRPATSGDSDKVAAGRLFADGNALLAQGTAESLRKAIDVFERALAVRRRHGDAAGQAEVLAQIGSAYEASDERTKALEYFNQALAIFRSEKNQPSEAITLSNLAGLYSFRGEHDRALAYYNDALVISRKIEDRRGEATTLNNMGGVYYSISEYGRALELYEQALPLIRAVKDLRGEAYTLINMGLIFDMQGEKAKALQTYQQSRSLLRQIDDRPGQVSLLNNLGLTYASLGERQQALDTYAEGLQVATAMGDRDGQASILNGLGAVYSALGEQEKALDHFLRALPLRRAIHDKAGEAATLNNIGHIQEELGNKGSARDHYTQALEIWRAMGDRDGQAVALNNLGTLAKSEGAEARALEYFGQALGLHRAIGSRSGIANTLTAAAAAHRSLGDPQKALANLEEALPLRRAVQDAQGESATLVEWGRLDRARGDLNAARAHLEEAVRITESLRNKVVSATSRAAYLSTVRDQYESYIDVLMRLHDTEPAAGHAARALQVSEMARARSLLELLNQAGIDVRAGVDPTLLQRKRDLQQRLNARAAQQTSLLSAKHSDTQAAALADQIARLTLELDDTDAQIRTTSPGYASLVSPAPLSLPEIQKHVLDDETLLLEYALGADRSYLWVASSRSLWTFTLAKRADIEPAVRRFYELLTERNRRLPKETDGQRSTRIRRSERDLAASAASLTRMLLQPAAQVLGRHRLLVVTDTTLQYIPFAALPEPGSDATPLASTHEIIHLPSASMIEVVRRELTGRSPPTRQVAVFADPVFTADDPRVQLTTKGPGSAQAREMPAAGNVAATRALDDLERSAIEVGLSSPGAQIPRLPFTRREADGIARSVSSKEMLRAVDFEASRARVMRRDLGLYRVVHFATHGFLNNRHPELSGIVLSLVNPRGEPQDGFLRLHDIYNLELPVDLVVLSACQTSLGKEVAGEGLIGLTRGFMYAGAAGVLASLWKVDDAATAALMSRFYQAMFEKRMRPAAALREAQLSLRIEERWRSPYFWAAFTLQGEWAATSRTR